MAIAFDAVSNVAQTTAPTDLSWTHTPVGTPRGALVLVDSNNIGTDTIGAVTYGGVTMTEVTDSPVLKATGELHSVHAFFLGASVPTGAQTVLVDVTSGTQANRAVCITVTAAADTAVEDTATLASDAAGTAPSVTLATGAGVECFVAGLNGSGRDGVAGIDKGADYTEILENDYGLQTSSWQRRTSNSTGGNVTVDWSFTADDDATIIAVALKEASAPPTVVPSLALLGVGT